jgi:hypothetical protein
MWLARATWLRDVAPTSATSLGPSEIVERWASLTITRWNGQRTEIVESLTAEMTSEKDWVVCAAATDAEYESSSAGPEVVSDCELLQLL